MTSDRTRRFDRLLKMQQQVERLAQWRMSAATAERAAAERERDAAVNEALQLRDDRESLLSGECRPLVLRSNLAAEQLAELRLAAARGRLQERIEAERRMRDLFLAARKKTRQSEKLEGSARDADEVALEHAQQLEWDEHGRRKLIRDAVQPVAVLEPADRTAEQRAAEVES